MLHAGDLIVDDHYRPTTRNIRLNNPYQATFKVARIAGRLAQIEIADARILYEFMLEHFYEVFLHFPADLLRNITAIFTISVLSENGAQRIFGVQAVRVFDDRSFNAELIMRLIEDEIQSADDFRYEDFEYSFVFAVDSYRYGAGTDNPLDCEFSKVDKGTDESHSDEQGPLSCLAVALAYNLVRYEKATQFQERQARGEIRKVSPNLSFTRLKAQTLLRARQLMTAFNWGPVVASMELHRFVRQHKEFRIALFMRGVDHPSVYQDPDYEEYQYDRF